MKLGQRVSDDAKQRISESMKRHRAAERERAEATGRSCSKPRTPMTEAQTAMLQRHELRLLAANWRIPSFPQTAHVYEDEAWLVTDPWGR